MMFWPMDHTDALGQDADEKIGLAAREVSETLVDRMGEVDES